MRDKLVAGFVGLLAVFAATAGGSSEANAKPKWDRGGGSDRGYHGGPPSWAPAHGYRRKHQRSGGYGYRSGTSYGRPGRY
jgi:hypothetical protein